jgi:hypothetical protein
LFYVFDDYAWDSFYFGDGGRVGGFEGAGGVRVLRRLL